MEENHQIKNIIKADEDNALDILTKKEQKDLLRKAWERLPEDEQFLVQHFYSEELSVDELAGVTGLSKSNIKVKLHRIRKKLHDMLTYAYSDEFYD